MPKIQYYGYNKCSTCLKAAKWLSDYRIKGAELKVSGLLCIEPHNSLDSTVLQVV